MKEEWKYIRGYNKKFAVSDRGKVWVNRFDRSKVLSAGNLHDYRSVVLWFNGKRKTCLIHRLVAKVFIPNPLNLPEVNHKNGKKWDNRVENLEWCTHAENMKHAGATKLMNPQKGERNGRSKLTKKEVEKIRKLKGKHSQQKIGDIFGISQAMVSDIHNNKCWKS